VQCWESSAATCNLWSCVVCCVQCVWYFFCQVHIQNNSWLEICICPYHRVFFNADCYVLGRSDSGSKLEEVFKLIHAMWLFFSTSDVSSVQPLSACENFPISALLKVIKKQWTFFLLPVRSI
jgi:hypothetical protein